MVRSSAKDKDVPPPPPGMSVTTIELQAGDVSRGIVANGTVYPWQEIIISPEVGGYRVAAVNVDVGDRVKRGQELVRLSDVLLVSDVTSKQANLQSAQATLDNAASAHRRARALTTSGAFSQADVDKLRSEELAAQARVEVAKADLEASELRVRYTHVTAPDDGIISVRMVAIGQTASIGGEMLRMVRQGRVEWRAEIPEARMRDIHTGQLVRLTTADGSTLDGKVRTVSPTIESATRAGLIYVDIASENARPGMYARGEIILDNKAAQMAPIASVVIQDGYSYLFVVNGEPTGQQTVQRRRVETGMVKGNSIEILSGIQAGEHIVEKGAGFLKDGDRVTVVLPDARKAA
ncbi:MAG: efflux RND transporter periplasmic adaptor subunit [Steroidobacteraceae bacterium]